MGAAAAATTRFVSSVAVMMLIAVFAQSQTCSTSLGRLTGVSTFPGARWRRPTADCCSALQGIDHDCICNTLRIASRIPTQCNLPALTCGAN